MPIAVSQVRKRGALVAPAPEYPQCAGPGLHRRQIRGDDPSPRPDFLLFCTYRYIIPLDLGLSRPDIFTVRYRNAQAVQKPRGLAEVFRFALRGREVTRGLDVQLMEILLRSFHSHRCSLVLGAAAGLTGCATGAQGGARGGTDAGHGELSRRARRHRLRRLHRPDGRGGFRRGAGTRLGLPRQGQLQGRGAGQEGRQALRDRPAAVPGRPRAGQGDRGPD